MSDALRVSADQASRRDEQALRQRSARGMINAIFCVQTTGCQTTDRQ